MANHIVLAKSLPPSAQLTAQRMALVGFPERTWIYNPNHDLADMGNVLQVRDIKGTARKTKVDQYAGIMKPYTMLRDELTMPPVVFTADGKLIDGNTRTEAAIKLGWLTFPAFTLNFSYENQAQAILDQFLELAAILNLSHGDNLDRANTESIIARLLKDGTSATDLARRLGVSKTTVQNVQYARIARLRAEGLGIPFEADHISRTHLSNLGRLNDRFNNDVFEAIMDLTVKGKVGTTDQMTLVRQVLAETSDAAKLALIEAELTGRNGIVHGRAIKPSPAAQLRQALGKVNAGDPGDLIEPVPANWRAHKSAARQAIDNLEKMLNRQYQLEEDYRQNQGA